MTVNRPLTQVGPSGTNVFDSLCRLLSGREDQVVWDRFTPAGWDQFAQQACSEGVAPLICNALDRRGWPPAIPTAVRDALTAEAYHTAAHNTLLMTELDRILSALAQADIPVIVLKGAALARTLYPDPALRPMVDLDLLVKPAHIQPACRALNSLNYHLHKVSGRLVMHNAANAGLPVEVHWSAIVGDTRPADSPVDWLWQHTGPYNPSYPACIQTLTTSANLLYLAAHLMIQHRGAANRLIWFYDLYLLIHQETAPIDWSNLFSIAARFNWAQALLEALHGVHNYFGVPSNPVLAGLIDQARQLGLKPIVHDQPASRIVSTLSPLEWRVKLFLISRILFPSPDYMRQRYQPRFGWLLPFLYPRRWVDILRSGIFS